MADLPIRYGHISLAVRDEKLAVRLVSDPIYGSGRAIALRAPTTLQRLWPVVDDGERTPGADFPKGNRSHR